MSTRSRLTSVLVVIVALSIGLSGCLMGSHTDVRREGTYVSDATLHKIEPGKTSASWVRATLGEPSEKTQIGHGHEVWKYCYKETRDSQGYVFVLFAGSDSRVTDGRVFVELRDGVVTKTWRG